MVAPSGNTSCFPRATVRIRSRAISASNAGRGGAFDELAELAFILHGAEPAPIADHMQVGAFTEERPLVNSNSPERTRLLLTDSSRVAEDEARQLLELREADLGTAKRHRGRERDIVPVGEGQGQGADL